MSGPRIVVLYEDQLGGDRTAFGPHVLLLACVARRLELPVPSLLRDHCQAVPKKGNIKVIEAVRREGARLLDCGPVVAVVDEDKIREPLHLAATACKRLVVDFVRDGVHDVEVVLLEQNVEDVVAACCRLLGCQPPTRKLTPNERDKLLGRTAARPDLLERFEAAMPSFKRLVDAVGDRLTKATDGTVKVAVRRGGTTITRRRPGTAE